MFGCLFLGKRITIGQINERSRRIVEEIALLVLRRTIIQLISKCQRLIARLVEETLIVGTQADRSLHVFHFHVVSIVKSCSIDTSIHLRRHLTIVFQM